MFDKLDFITEKYDELAQKVSDPEIINNQPVWQKHVKEMGEMEPIVKKYKEYKKAKSDLVGAKEMLEEGDEEMRELAKMEISELEETIKQQEADLKILLLPKDPNDEKNVILEIRAGTGGDEAALFGADPVSYTHLDVYKRQVLGLSLLCGLDHKEYVTLLPKSITTAIGMEMCIRDSLTPSACREFARRMILIRILSITVCLTMFSSGSSPSCVSPCRTPASSCLRENPKRCVEKPFRSAFPRCV